MKEATETPDRRAATLREHLPQGVGPVVHAAIVDDSEQARASVRQQLLSLTNTLGLQVRCWEYPSGMALLLDDPNDLDILFIDVEMPHASGLETVAALRQRQSKLAVVFVTAFESYAVDGYSVQAQRYLVKPVSEQRFNREIAPLLEDVIASRSQTVAVRTADGLYAVELRSIAYLSTGRGKQILVRTTTGDLTTHGTLSQWEKQLPAERFARCHSGFLLNLSFVRRIGATEVELVGGETVPLSKHRRRAFLDAFTRYVGSTA